jgi:hypothetical protein
VTVPTMVPCDCANNWDEKTAANMAMAAKVLVIIRIPLVTLSADEADKKHPARKSNRHILSLAAKDVNHITIKIELCCG